MTRHRTRQIPASHPGHDTTEPLLRAGLDALGIGFAVFDAGLRLVACNAAFAELRGYPEALTRPGTGIAELYRFNAGRGDYGPGDTNAQVAERLGRARSREPHELEYPLASGRVLSIRYTPIPRGGLLVSYADITARKRAEAELSEASRKIDKQNKMLTELSERLSKYLAPQVYSSIFSGRQKDGLSSRRRKLTVFFSDIAGFTGITERLESEELTTLLNHYLTEMSRIALEHSATLDKYIGDGIMAFFGDPESRGPKADALACLRMAMAMQDRMGELAELWHDRGIEAPIRIRVGINTGFCTVGNFGSHDRMDYTIIGNAVNIASRLQSAARPGEILVANETFSLTKDAIAFEEQAPIPVKGFSHPVQCYRVIGDLGALKAEGRIIREYGEGVRVFLDLYRSDREQTIRMVEHILRKLKSG